MLSILLMACSGFDTFEEKAEEQATPIVEDAPIAPFSTLYLLSRELGRDGRIHRLDMETMTSVDLGELDCDFETDHDYLAALTSDPKGMLWGLSKKFGIYRVHPQQMTCSYSGVMANSDSFQADSMAFHEQNGVQRFYLSGYFSTADAAASTALAFIANGEIEHLGGVSNFEGQGNVMDLAAVSDGRLYGLRSWGNYAELAQYSTNSASQMRQLRIPIDNGEAFAFLVDDQVAWLFTSSNPSGGSTLHRYDLQEESLLDSHLLDMTVVGAAGLY